MKKNFIYFLLLIQQLIASGTHIVGSLLTKDLDPALVLWLRAIIVNLLYLFYYLINRKNLKKIERKDIIILLVMGLLNIPLNQFLFLNALKLTTPPNTALAYALTPAFVLMIAFIFLKEKVSRFKGLGVFLAVAGAGILFFNRGIELNSENFLGDMLALTASFSWAVYTIIGKKMSQKYGGVFSNGLAMFTGMLLFQPIFFNLNVPLDLETISGVNWLRLIYIGAITSGVGYAIWYYALTKIEAGRVAVFNNVQPILTTLLSILILGELLETVMEWNFILGASSIISGVYLTQKF